MFECIFLFVLGIGLWSVFVIFSIHTKMYSLQLYYVVSFQVCQKRRKGRTLIACLYDVCIASKMCLIFPSF